MDSDTFYSPRTDDGLVFGLKGRFCQPRPQAWVGVEKRWAALKVRFAGVQFAVESSLQDEWPFDDAFPGLRPGLTETALQAECQPVFRLQLEKSVAVQLTRK